MKSLLGKAHDPNFWRTVREDELYRPLVDDVLSLWEREGTADIPSLSYSAYRRFVFDGDRKTYEAPYFQRRRVLGVSAILSLIYPERQEYLVRLMDVIYAICDEYTWCLPAHQTELGVNNNRHIDLFAAETSMALAEIYTLLGDRMEPLIGDRIRVEIDRRIVDSYRETRFLWEKTPINWAAVCACSVGCTLMLMRPELYVEWKERLMATKQCYLSGLPRTVFARRASATGATASASLRSGQICTAPLPTGARIGLPKTRLRPRRLSLGGCFCPGEPSHPFRTAIALAATTWPYCTT